MSRRHPKRRMTGKHFAAIPLEVLTSEAFRTLPNYGVRLLLVAAAQYRGMNNGDLAVTRATAHQFGVVSQEQLVRGLAQLLERGLLVKTRQGGKKPLGPSLYALTWQPIDDIASKFDTGISWSTTPANTWSRWRSSPTASGPPADQTARGDDKSTGLPAVHIGTAGGAEIANIGTAGGAETPNIGTAGSPPSRSPRGGLSPGHLQIVAGGRTAGGVP
jgi:hypothetical protein